MQLRPIGTILKTSSFDHQSTIGVVSVTTWRVKGHTLCNNYGKIRYLEEVEVVDIKGFPPKRWTKNTYALMKQKEARCKFERFTSEK